MSKKLRSCVYPVTISRIGPEQMKAEISSSGAPFGHAVSASSRICKTSTNLNLRCSQLLPVINDFGRFIIGKVHSFIFAPAMSRTITCHIVYFTSWRPKRRLDDNRSYAAQR